MQSRRRKHGSSGELDVFGATRYFTNGFDCAMVAHPGAERLTQAKVVMHYKRMAENFRRQDDEQLGVHDLLQAKQMELAKPAGKSKLAAFFGFMVSPSPGASFRKRPPPPTSSGSTAAGNELTNPMVSSSTFSSGESTDDLITSAASMQLEDRGYGFDLGIATGDTRLRGVKVVRGGAGAGDEERWVVRCTPCWHQEEQHAENFYAASSDDHADQVEHEDEDGANPGNWESDSGSDLFELDIE